LEIFRPIEIEYIGEVLPQSRPRLGKYGVYEDSKIRAYKEKLAWQGRLSMQENTPLSRELAVTIYIYRKWAKTSRRFGDVDNHAKAILDALTGVVYLDDAQITEAHIYKVQADFEGAKIIVR